MLFYIETSKNIKIPGKTHQYICIFSKQNCSTENNLQLGGSGKVPTNCHPRILDVIPCFRCHPRESRDLDHIKVITVTGSEGIKNHFLVF